MPTDAELAARVEAFTGATDAELAARVEGFAPPLGASDYDTLGGMSLDRWFPGATQGALDVTETAARGMVRGIPFVGPALESGIESVEQVLTGQDLADIQARGEALQAEYPGVDFAAELVGEWVIPAAAGGGIVGKLTAKPAKLTTDAINKVIGSLDDAARQAFRAGNQAGGKELFKRARGVEALARLRGANSIGQAQGRIRALVSNRKQLGRFPPEIQQRLRDLAFANEGDFARVAKDLADEFLTGLVPGARTAVRSIAQRRGVREIDRSVEDLVKSLQQERPPQ